MRTRANDISLDNPCHLTVKKTWYVQKIPIPCSDWKPTAGSIGDDNTTTERTMPRWFDASTSEGKSPEEIPSELEDDVPSEQETGSTTMEPDTMKNLNLKVEVSHFQGNIDDSLDYETPRGSIMDLNEEELMGFFDSSEEEAGEEANTEEKSDKSTDDNLPLPMESNEETPIKTEADDTKLRGIDELRHKLKERKARLADNIPIFKMQDSESSENHESNPNPEPRWKKSSKVRENIEKIEAKIHGSPSPRQTDNQQAFTHHESKMSAQETNWRQFVRDWNSKLSEPSVVQTLYQNMADKACHLADDPLAMPLITTIAVLVPLIYIGRRRRRQQSRPVDESIEEPATEQPMDHQERPLQLHVMDIQPTRNLELDQREQSSDLKTANDTAVPILPCDLDAHALTEEVDDCEAVLYERLVQDWSFMLPMKETYPHGCSGCPILIQKLNLLAKAGASSSRQLDLIESWITMATTGTKKSQRNSKLSTMIQDMQLYLQVKYKLPESAVITLLPFIMTNASIHDICSEERLGEIILSSEERLEEQRKTKDHVRTNSPVRAGPRLSVETSHDAEVVQDSTDLSSPHLRARIQEIREKKNRPARTPKKATADGKDTTPTAEQLRSRMEHLKQKKQRKKQEQEAEKQQEVDNDAKKPSPSFGESTVDITTLSPSNSIDSLFAFDAVKREFLQQESLSKRERRKLPKKYSGGRLSPLAKEAFKFRERLHAAKQSG